MSGARVLFLPAFSAQVGGGHALRCFTLAHALTRRGAVCGVALDAEGSRALRGFRPSGVEGLQRGELLVTAKGFRADAVVIDDYGLDAAAEAPLADAGLRIAVIDDLADRPHRCELLVDASYGRKAADYDGLVPAGAQVLTGPDHALLRPDFAAARPGALTRRKGAFGHSALVSLGLTDVGGVTAKVARHLSGLVPMQVVLGAGAPSLESVRALPGVTVHVDATDMPALIAAADIGIGGGGVSVWERACLGLPSILLILADNQAPMARALDEAGVVVAIDARADGFEPRLTTAVERLFSDQELRCNLSQKAARLCDGLGADRVADALLARLAA
jgi:UDP-2,4-diacetamido-2,4,6-trideoxy-beta-L-altropyranose hydrolase